jgi:hypothetical protein
MHGTTMILLQISHQHSQNRKKNENESFNCSAKSYVNQKQQINNVDSVITTFNAEAS